MSEASPDLSGLQIQERGLRHAPATDAPSPILSELRNRVPGPNALRGHCRRLCIRPGFDLTFYDVTIARGMPDGGEVPAGLTLTVLLDGRGESCVSQSAQTGWIRPIPYTGGITYFCFCETPVMGRTRLPPDSRFHAIELRIGLDFLDGIGMLDVFRKADASHPLCHVAQDGVWIGLLPTPDGIAEAVAKLDTMDAAEAGGDLPIERCALSILSAAMALIRRPPGQYHAVSRDLKQLRAARQLILAAPERAWTIAGLARQVGLTEKRLKNGFRTQFGSPVNAFVQQVRLQKAHRLISENGTSVTEAALLVGYANPSHFALLFRRRYGMTASQISRRIGTNPLRPISSDRDVVAALPMDRAHRRADRS